MHIVNIREIKWWCILPVVMMVVTTMMMLAMMVLALIQEMHVQTAPIFQALSFLSQHNCASLLADIISGETYSD